MHYQEIKEKAIRLRKEGYSYNYIVKQIPVAKSTLSEWLSHISFVPNEHTVKTIGNAHIASGMYHHNLRLERINSAELKAKKDLGIISKRDLFMLGLGIYIGEGAKTHNVTRISNSDPKILKIALAWFVKCFGVKKNQVRVRLHIYPDNKIEDCINYWSKKLNISKDQFTKSSIDTRVNKKKINNRKLPYGTAHMGIVGFGNEKFGSNLSSYILALINHIL